MMSFEQILIYAVKNGASDIHLTVGSPPAVRVDGRIRFIGDESLTPRDNLAFLDEILNENQKEKFLRLGDFDLAHSVSGLGRFRVNVLRQRGSVGIVLRHVKGKILGFEQLNLPPVMAAIADLRRGLVLITGTTGSGKSTTLAAMIDRVNEARREHIITLEDPIEFLHKNKKSIVTQREVAIDTRDFKTALRAAMREDPDVILIGEMRDAETVRTALASAETGHLVLSTLHTVDAVETLNRIIDFFEPHQQLQIRKQLASVLRAVVSQRILPLKDGAGRVVAAEILIGNRTVRDFIEQGKSFKDIVKLIEEGEKQYAMQTFDQALYKLFKDGRISEEIALHYASSAKDLKLRIQGMR